MQLVERSTRFTRVFKVAQKAKGNIGVLWSMVEKELGVEFPTTWQEATVPKDVPSPVPAAATVTSVGWSAVQSAAQFVGLSAAGPKTKKNGYNLIYPPGVRIKLKAVNFDPIPLEKTTTPGNICGKKKVTRIEPPKYPEIGTFVLVPPSDFGFKRPSPEEEHKERIKRWEAEVKKLEKVIKNEGFSTRRERAIKLKGLREDAIKAEKAADAARKAAGRVCWLDGMQIKAQTGGNDEVYNLKKDWVMAKIVALHDDALTVETLEDAHETTVRSFGELRLKDHTKDWPTAEDGFAEGTEVERRAEGDVNLLSSSKSLVVSNRGSEGDGDQTTKTNPLFGWRLCRVNEAEVESMEDVIRTLQQSKSVEQTFEFTRDFVELAFQPFEDPETFKLPPCLQQCFGVTSSRRFSVPKFMTAWIEIFVTALEAGFK